MAADRPSMFNDFLNQRISVITTDGRVFVVCSPLSSQFSLSRLLIAPFFVFLLLSFTAFPAQGTLVCIDGSTNIGLSGVEERLFDVTGVEVIPIGLILIRGDNMYVFARSSASAFSSLLTLFLRRVCTLELCLVSSTKKLTGNLI